MPSVIRCSAAACAPLACLALAGPAVAQVPTGCAGAQQAPTAKTIATARLATLCLINRERAAYGLAGVAMAPVVGWTAQTHSEQMVAKRFFAHSVGVGQLLSGVYWLYGQNIAWAEGIMAAPEIVVASWMASSGHRKNILAPDFNHIGIGIALGAPELTPLSAATYTTDFGAAIIKPAPAGAEPEKAPAANDPRVAAPAASDAREAAPAERDPRVVAPAVAPPGAERVMRPAVRLPKIKRHVKACSAKSGKKRGRSACVKRRPKITIKPRRGRSDATTVVIQQPS